jgi:hypothetical protein
MRSIPLATVRMARHRAASQAASGLSKRALIGAIVGQHRGGVPFPDTIHQMVDPRFDREYAGGRSLRLWTASPSRTAKDAATIAASNAASFVP